MYSNNSSKNSNLGMTLQKEICKRYKIVPNKTAREQFDAAYDEELGRVLDKYIEILFRDIGHIPTKCLTYTKSEDFGKKYSPHNFILDNGETLSIRTNKKGDKISPRVVGQCGLKQFNLIFRDVLEYEINDKNQIKKVIYENIHLMLPIFLDYFLSSDIIVWFFGTDKNYDYHIFKSNLYTNMEMERERFTFTKSLASRKESITLKYENISIAEIQIHKNRTFKFRFCLKTLFNFLEEQKSNNETLGITVEKTICDYFNILPPQDYARRASLSLEKELIPIIKNAFVNLPRVIEHTGTKKGERGGSSKCSYDFVLEGNKTLSVKSNIGKMVCPPEVGQPSASVCYDYFKDFIDGDHIDSFVFKKMVLSKVDQLIPIYLAHLFDSDYLLWVYKKNNNFFFKIIEKNYGANIVWEKNHFSFTKNTIEERNESNTLKYDEISFGNFQVHTSRNSYKFRFHFENLINIIKRYEDANNTK